MQATAKHLSRHTAATLPGDRARELRSRYGGERGVSAKLQSGGFPRVLGALDDAQSQLDARLAPKNRQQYRA